MATAWTRAKAWTRNATTRHRISLCTKRSIQNGTCRIIPPPVAATRQTANREPIAAFGGDIVKQDTARVVAGGHGEADFTRPRSIIRDGGGDHVGDRRHHDRSPAATRAPADGYVTIMALSVGGGTMKDRAKTGARLAVRETPQEVRDKLKDAGIPIA
jgi:hypothetical protein